MVYRLVYEASDAQTDFLRLKTRYRAFIGGVGSGKTWAGAMLANILLTSRPNTTGLIGGPTYPMIRDVIMPAFFEVVPKEFIASYSMTEHRVTFKNRARVIFRSLENVRHIDNTARGLTLNWFWIDEAPYLSEYAFKVLQGRLRQGEDHVGIITGTPKGYNWVYERFVKKTQGDNYDIIGGGVGGRVIASDSNPFLGKEYYDDLRQAYTGEYQRQEYEGRFVRFEGLVYTEFGPDNILPVSVVKRLDFKEYTYGYDAGYRNPRVLLKIGITPDDEYVIIEEFYRRESVLSDSIPIFEEMHDGLGDIMADPSAKGEIEEMRKLGLPVEPGNNDVQAGIQKVKGLLKQRYLLVSEACQNTINELNSYRWDEGKDKPVKEMDHAMDALRYALLEDRFSYSFL